MNRFGQIIQFPQEMQKKTHIISAVSTHPSITFVSKSQTKYSSCKLQVNFHPVVIQFDGISQWESKREER